MFNVGDKVCLNTISDRHKGKTFIISFIQELNDYQKQQGDFNKTSVPIFRIYLKSEANLSAIGTIWDIYENGQNASIKYVDGLEMVKVTPIELLVKHQNQLDDIWNKIKSRQV